MMNWKQIHPDQAKRFGISVQLINDPTYKFYAIAYDEHVLDGEAKLLMLQEYDNYVKINFCMLEFEYMNELDERSPFDVVGRGQYLRLFRHEVLELIKLLLKYTIFPSTNSEDICFMNFNYEDVPDTFKHVLDNPIKKTFTTPVLRYYVRDVVHEPTTIFKIDVQMYGSQPAFYIWVYQLPKDYKSTQPIVHYLYDNSLAELVLSSNCLIEFTRLLEFALAFPSP